VSAVTEKDVIEGDDEFRRRMTTTVSSSVHQSFTPAEIVTHINRLNSILTADRISRNLLGEV
jgi:predicted component of type VI protein secretion system